jgi:hypothetical protein
VTTLQTEYSEHELLESIDYAEPLIAGGVKCHGGFDDDGSYVSPRTKNRVPAIEAWQQNHRETFGTELLDLPLDTWPENYPNVAQAKYLISEGVTDPISATLTRIGTVEGFGAMIRYSLFPDLQQCFDEDIRGTATAHLQTGLYEAHARDEAGFDDEGGHKQMWFASRDIAFENPVTDDQTQIMLERMGFTSNGPIATGQPPDQDAMRKMIMGSGTFPDVDPYLEALVERMTRLLLIEISAFHTFAWAEEVLSDQDLCAGEGEAARLVSYIRADETPHVEYLKTTLSEIRDRTIVGQSGKKIPGREVIGEVWDRAIKESLGERREANLKITLREVEIAVEGRKNGRDILERFHELGSIRPSTDGQWTSVPAGY